MTEETKRGFKRKTIIRTIKHKTDSWLASITDEPLRKRVAKNFFVSGGAIASMLLGDLPNDYDVYLTDLEVARDLANYYLAALMKEETIPPVAADVYEGEVGAYEQTNPYIPPKTDEKVSSIKALIVDNRVRIMIKSAGVLDEQGVNGYEYFEQLPSEEMDKYIDRLRNKKGKDFTPCVATSNAISLHGGVQIIFRFVGQPAEVHLNFDFEHCLGYYDPVGDWNQNGRDGLYVSAKTMEAILTKELRYVGSLYPVCSMFRIKKFLNRGWSITAGTMLKIAWDINELKLHIPSVLQEQLVGMDAAYFMQVIRLLKDKGDIDRTYLYEVINRVFDTDEFNTEWMEE